ncbi:MAG: metallophosphoesterase [Ilumatobacter sp.]
MIRVAQLSDTHFLEQDADAEGGFAYDTAAAFDAVRTHIEQLDSLDMVAVTGDIADHGRPAQYRRAADAFATLPAPVNVCPGNHDQDQAFALGMAAPTVGTSRAMEIGNWCFLFVDSNAGMMIPDDSGRLVDPDRYEDRLHANGSLGDREAAWIAAMCAATEAEHVFIWLHHPPDAPVGLTEDAAYAAEWHALIETLPNVRGLGAGHTHVPADYVLGNRPVFVCPALKNNFDLANKTLLPPGYRTYEFASDGTIQSEVHLMDGDEWPRHPIGRSVVALLNGELTWDQFDEILARRNAPQAD